MRAERIGLALVGLVALAALILALGGGLGGRAGQDPAARSNVRSRSDQAEWSAPGEVTPSRDLQGADPVAGALALPDEEGPGPGWLRLRVEAADTGRSLPVDLRLLSETRFHQASEDDFDLPLTPDVYQASLTHRGYEPLRLEDITIHAAQVTDLGVVQLSRGTASVRGAVRGPHLVGAPLVVELHGEGRSPCPECAWVIREDGRQATDPWNRNDWCGRCGYARAFSRLHRQADEPFRFPSLAAGRYQVRYQQQQGLAAGVIHEVTLAAGQQEYLDLVAPADPTVLFEVVDEAGESVVGEWQRDGTTVYSPLHFQFHRRPWGTAWAQVIPLPLLEQARAADTAAGQASQPTRAVLESVFSELGGLLEEEITEEESDSTAEADPPGRVRPVDQARTADHSLARLHYLPAHDADLSAAWEGRWVAVQQVPTDTWQVVVHCGRYRSDPVPLDVVRWDGHPLRVVLRQQDDSGSTDWIQLDWPNEVAHIFVQGARIEVSWDVVFSAGFAEVEEEGHSP